LHALTPEETVVVVRSVATRLSRRLTPLQHLLMRLLLELWRMALLRLQRSSLEPLLRTLPR
jgi:hypothetical protein